jgi:pyrroloquinoline quinone (PQQ) biosynthesis protein C
VRLYTFYNDFVTEEGSPLEILGTSYPLEYVSASSAQNVVENLIKRSPIPGISSGVTFLLGRAAADVGHIEELRTVLRLIKDPADQRAVLRAARMTAALFPHFFTRSAEV